MKTSNRLLVAFVSLIMVGILSFLVIARMNAEVATPGQKAHSNDQPLQGNGRLGLDSRTIPAFESIALHANMDVELTKTAGPLEITAEDNIFAQIVTVVDKGRLHIHWAQGRWVNRTLPVNIKIPFETLSLIELNDNGFIRLADTLQHDSLKVINRGNGDMLLEHLAVEHLSTHIEGNGDIEIGGEATQLKLNIYGSGDFDAQALQVQTADIHTEGRGGARLQVQKRIDGSIRGSGHIKFTGPAEMNVTKAGNGRLIRLD